MSSNQDETKTVAAGARRRQPHGPARPESSQPDPETGIRVGSRLGRYLVLYRVGSGGMGVVYAAFDPELRRKVALKVIRHLGPSHATAAASRIEAQAMARLAHPNAVTVYDIGVDGDRVFIAMELVAGVTLEEWLRREPKSWREVLGVLTQAGRGLAAAHRCGIVHQDFKPSNVLVAAEDDVRVLDFGLARLRSEGGASEGPRAEHDDEAGLRGGTPGYMAPEQRAGEDPSPAGDQYGFCVTLLASLTGRYPKTSDGDPGADDAASLWRSPRRACGRIPRWLRRALERGLSRKPEDRFPTMESLLDEISLQRRRARTLRAAAILGVLALAALGIALFEGRLAGAAPCAGAERFWDGIWDDHRKAQLRTAVRRLESPAAQEALDFVETALDRYSTEWAGEHEDACRATLVFHDQSQRVLDLRMACLQDRLAEADALVREIEGAEEDLLLKAPRAADQLRTIATCSASTELTLLSPPPTEFADLDRLRTRVERQRARLRLSVPVDTAALLAAAERSRQVGYRPLEAQALFVLGAAADSRKGDSEEAERVLLRSFWAAVAAGDRVTQADVAIRLMSLFSYHLPKPELSAFWSEFATAAVAPIQDSRPDIAQRLQANLGYRSWAARDFEQAGFHYRQALEMNRRAPTLPRAQLITILNNASLTVPGEQAVEYLDRAIELAEDYGKNSPLLARPLLNLSHHLVGQGRLPEALERARRSLELSQASSGPEQRENAYPLVGVGQILLRMDRIEEAVDHLRRGIDLTEKGFGEGHFLSSLFKIDLAEALFLLGDEDEALRVLGQAESGLADQPEDSEAHFYLTPVKCYLLAARGRLRDVPGIAERRASAYQSPARESVMVWLARGTAEHGLGRSERAIESLEKALALSGPGSQPRLEAEARFLLARVLYPSEPGRALGLARSARESLAGGNPLRNSVLEQVDAWIAEVEPVPSEPAASRPIS